MIKLNVQFCHKRIIDIEEYFPEIGGLDKLTISPKGGETIALEVIEPWFFDTLTVNDFFEKRVGTARCSDEDNYCKKTGRELALARMKPRRLVVADINKGDNTTIITLIDAQNNKYLLRKTDGYKVHFIEYQKASK